MTNIRKLNYIFNRKQKIQLLCITILIILGAFFELIGITAVLPFINVAVSPNSIFKNHYLSFFYTELRMSSPNSFLAILAFILILIYLIKNIYLTLMNYVIFRFTYNNQKKLAHRMLSIYLKQPYLFFVSHNSADLIRNVSDDTNMLFDSVLSFMQLLVEIIVCSLLLIFLLITDKSITLGVAVILVLFMMFFVKFLKKNIQLRGEKVRENRVGMSKWLLQTFGGIKETKIMGKEKFFLDNYGKEFQDFANNHCIYQTLAYIPKPLMETMCISSVLLVVALKLVRGVQSEYFISTISVFAVAAFRLLPAFNRITGYISRIMFNKSSVDAVYHDLKQVENLENMKKNTINDKENVLEFSKEIRIENLTFAYPNCNNYVINNVSFSIPKNKSVAFIGPSGAGKTTLADIILGVLLPNKGTIKVDGKNIFDNINKWHSKIGYIPQNIYLLDDSIKRNIAYGLTDEEIDQDKLNNAILEAQLKDFIDGLEEGVDMKIGERGVRLSGGQRQRIGIARALYTNPEILVLDEATSALDNDTEEAVMNAINHLAGRKTLLIIAHRLSTIKNCDFVYEVKEGNVVLEENKND